MVSVMCASQVLHPFIRPFASRGRRCVAVLASSLLLLPLGAQAFPGRGGFAGGGGDRFGGGGFGASDWQSGYQGGHPLFGAGSRPAWGDGDGGNGFNRSNLNPQPGDNRYQFNQSGQININNNRATINRTINGNNNFYNRNSYGFNDGWRNGGYWNDRPWGTGWFNGGAATWGWWGGSAAAWGMAGLATGALIGGLVNAASAQSSTVILVPQTSYLLNFASVEAVGSYGVSFNYQVNGTQLLGAANCQQGLLNGQVPGNGDQAQLLNAVCQVAYGSGS